MKHLPERYYQYYNFSVNDGSGKLPAYRGLADAVKSIVRKNGLKGLYQVLLFVKSIAILAQFVHCLF